MKIENILIKRIQESENGGEPSNSASWHNQEGVLISRAEALELVKVIGQLKSLEAASYGMTLHSLFLLTLKGFEIHIRHSDNVDNIKVIIRNWGSFTTGEITKEAIQTNGKAVDDFFTRLVASVK